METFIETVILVKVLITSEEISPIAATSFLRPNFVFLDGFLPYSIIWKRYILKVMIRSVLSIFQHLKGHPNRVLCACLSVCNSPQITVTKVEDQVSKLLTGGKFC